MIDTGLQWTAILDHITVFPLLRWMRFIFKGTRHRVAKSDGQYHDEKYMAQLLEA
ncbi:hypothetical protein Q0N12_11910 [Rossellomorea marisflavi]